MKCLDQLELGIQSQHGRCAQCVCVFIYVVLLEIFCVTNRVSLDGQGVE